MVVFACEVLALGESLAAEHAGRTPRFPTISGCCWQHRRLSPVVLAALAVHLYHKPPNKGAQWPV